MNDENNKEQTVSELCALIVASLPSAKQTTKWNPPNFEIDNCDLITLNISPKHPVRIVFHRGAKAVDTKTGSRLVTDDSGRLTWATDQRAYTSFSDLAAVQNGAIWLTDFCQKWAEAARYKR
jgi:hypothetical protein